MVQKYGGTSVGDTARIRDVADRIVRACEEGQDVVVVCAMEDKNVFQHLPEHRRGELRSPIGTQSPTPSLLGDGTLLSL